jgi:hypothetical protein
MSSKETKIKSFNNNKQATLNINDENNTEIDLSTTLVERRKRLHNLANEINNWEDEPTPHK